MHRWFRSFGRSRAPIKLKRSSTCRSPVLQGTTGHTHTYNLQASSRSSKHTCDSSSCRQQSGEGPNRQVSYIPNPSTIFVAGTGGAGSGSVPPPIRFAYTIALVNSDEAVTQRECPHWGTGVDTLHEDCQNSLWFAPCNNTFRWEKTEKTRPRHATHSEFCRAIQN